MLFDLFIKIILTPENVLGLIWSIITTVCMCLIFQAWEEKWWKSLVPFYGTYIIYKNTWKQLKWLFLVEIFLQLLSAKCASFIKKYIIHNSFYTIETYIKTENFVVGISVEKVLACMAFLLISALGVCILKRVTYMKICASLSIQNIFLKIGTFLLPQIFLLVDYAVFYKKQAELKNKVLSRHISKQRENSTEVESNV